MMRLETEQRLADHLMNIAIHERIVFHFTLILQQIENERIALNHIYSFQPTQAFKRVDKQQNFKINAYDLANFLKDNGHNVQSLDLSDLIKQYDHDNDGYLDMLEFSNVVLTATDFVLRKRARERNEYPTDFFKQRLSQDIESRLARLLMMEIDGIKELSREKDMLKNRHDFSRHDAFRTIDSYQMNSLLRDDFKNFMIKHGLEASTLDADNIMRRLDLDKDGRITQSEFQQYFDKISISCQKQQPSQSANIFNTPQRQSRNDTLEVKQEKLSKTEYKHMDQFEQNRLLFGIKFNHTTPLRKTVTPQKQIKTPQQYESQDMVNLDTTPSPTKQQESPTQQHKQLTGRKLNLDDVEEVKECSSDSQSEIRSKCISLKQSANKKKLFHTLEKSDELKLVEAFKSMIYLESEVEKSKQQISLKADFNLLDAFKLFDTKITGELTIEDVETGFQNLGVYALKEEITLFFKRYDANGDHKIRYLEFVDAFTPKDKIYANHLQSKKPNFDPKNMPLSKDTRFVFAETIRTMLKCEGYSEQLRQNLSVRRNFSISAAFSTIDMNNNGYLTKDEIKQFLEKHEYFATVREVDLVFDRMDKDFDGKISFNEFFSEIAPKFIS